MLVQWEITPWQLFDSVEDVMAKSLQTINFQTLLHILMNLKPSVNSFKWSEVTQVSARKTDFPLKVSIKDCHACKSALASHVSLIKWKGLTLFTVRSIKRHKNARPGQTTMQAKLSKPIKDWRDRNLIFFLCIADISAVLILTILSCGRRHSIFSESTSIP